jgi:hypothetical protein
MKLDARLSDRPFPLHVTFTPDLGSRSENKGVTPASQSVILKMRSRTLLFETRSRIFAGH